MKSVFELLFVHTIVAVWPLMCIGLFCAWKLWKYLGFKSLFCFYIIRMVWVCLGYYFFPTAIAGDWFGWQMHARWILDGKVPGIDFLSPYSLGFNGFLSMGVWLWDSPNVLVVLFSVVEFCAVLLFYSLIKRVSGCVVAKRTIILYLSSSICYVSAKGIQDETLILLGVAASLCLILQSKKMTACFTCCLAVLFSKIIAIVYFIPVILSGRIRSALLLSLFCVVYYGGLLLAGVRPIMFKFGRALGLNAIADSCDAMQTLGNVWYLASWTPLYVKYGVGLFVLMIFVLSLSGKALKAWMRRDLQFVLLSTIGIVLVFYMFIPGAWVYYLLPICPLLFYYSLVDQEVRVHRAWKVAAVMVWAWIVCYPGDKQTWLPRSVAPVYLGFYYVIYFTVMGWVVYGIRQNLTSPWQGAKDLILEIFAKKEDEV